MVHAREVHDWVRTSPAYEVFIMKNVAYKNVMIALGGNNAVVMTEASQAKGQYKVMTDSSSFIVSLKALDFMLDKIADNSEITPHVTRIYVPDMLKGFALGTFVEYIRTNTTSSGRKFTDEEKSLVLAVANKLMMKGLNVKVMESRFMPKELKGLKDATLAAAKEVKANAPAPAKAAPVAQAPAKSPVIAKLEELMTKALEEADFDTYDKLEARLNKLTSSAPVAEAPAVEEENHDDLEDNSIEVDEELAEMDC